MKLITRIFILLLFFVFASLNRVAHAQGLNEKIPAFTKHSASKFVPKSVSPNVPSTEEIPQILDNFEKYAMQAMKDSEIPGMAIGIIYKGEVIYQKAFGVKTAGQNDPVTTDTVFQIGSASKAFTTALMAMMVDEGKFKWTDRVVDLLPDFQLYDSWVNKEFQVRDLVAQHSGMPGYAAGTPGFFDYSRPAIRYFERYIKPVTSFRSEFAYQNCLFMDAAALLEKVTGKTWEQLVEERILQPLGMTNSTPTMEGLIQSANRTLGHRRPNDWHWGSVQPVTSGWPYFNWVYTMGPAGSVSCSIKDLSKWAQFQLNDGTWNGKQIISLENLSYTHQPQTIVSAPETGTQTFYCLGWVYETYQPYPIIWHNGGTLSGTSMVSFIPEADLAFVSVSNMRYPSIGDALHYAFYDRFFKNENPQDWAKSMLDNVKAVVPYEQVPVKPANPKPSPLFANLVGNYQNAAYGRIKIEQSENADSLRILIGPNNKKFLLSPWDGNDFAASMPDYTDYADFVTFQTNSQGIAESVHIAMLDESPGVGDFIRIKDFAPELGWLPDASIVQVEGLVGRYIQSEDVPGVVVGIWIPGQGKYFTARGKANLETGLSRNLDDPFRIGSVTKTFTATVVLQLIDEGKLSFTTPLSEFYPDLPNAKNITVEHLLQMRSGIPDALDEAYLTRMYKESMKPVSIEEILAPLYSIASKFETPGVKTIYRNINYILLEAIVEKSTGNPLSKEITNRILTPLDLKNSLYPVDPTMPGNTHGYFWDEDKGGYVDKTDVSPTWSRGAGAMISTLSDLRTFAKALYQGNLLKPTTQASRLLTFQMDGSPAYYRYGKGILQYGNFWGHNGSILGSMTNMYYHPKSGGVIVTNVNTDYYANAKISLINELIKILYPDDLPWAEQGVQTWMHY